MFVQSFIFPLSLSLSLSFLAMIYGISCNYNENICQTKGLGVLSKVMCQFNAVGMMLVFGQQTVEFECVL